MICVPPVFGRGGSSKSAATLLRSWAPFRADLGASLADLGASLADLGASLADLGASLADLGASLADLGASLADLGALHFREVGTAVLRLPARSFKKEDS